MEKLAAASGSAWLVQTYSGKKYRSVTVLVAERYFFGPTVVLVPCTRTTGPL